MPGAAVYSNYTQSLLYTRCVGACLGGFKSVKIFLSQVMLRISEAYGESKLHDSGILNLEREREKESKSVRINPSNLVPECVCVCVCVSVFLRCTAKNSSSKIAAAK